MSTCKPILYNTQMVRAILAGTKTQMRLVINSGTSVCDSASWDRLDWSAPDAITVETSNMFERQARLPLGRQPLGLGLHLRAHTKPEGWPDAGREKM